MTVKSHIYSYGLSLALLFGSCASNHNMTYIANELRNFQSTNSSEKSTSYRRTVHVKTPVDSAIETTPYVQQLTFAKNESAYLVEHIHSECKTRTTLTKPVSIEHIFGSYDEHKEHYQTQVIHDFKTITDKNMLPITIDKYAIDSLPKKITEPFTEEIIYTVVKQNKTSLLELLSDTTETKNISQIKAYHILEEMLQK